MAGAADATIRYLARDGAERTRALVQVDARDVVAGEPIRRPTSYRGQRHYPGLFWCATTRRHLVYESLLELAWLWLADFDPQVAQVASQPFHLAGRDGGRTRNRYPDFMWVDHEGHAHVVDVKHPRALTRPEVRESLTWTGAVVRERGWTYTVWSEYDHVLLRNVRLIAAARRDEVVPESDVATIVDLVKEATAFRDLEEVAQVADKVSYPRAAILAALWRGRLSCDLSIPLGPGSLLRSAS